MIQLHCESPLRCDTFNRLITKWGLIHDPSAQFALIQTEDKVVLRKVDEPKLGDVLVDFGAGMLAHRRRFGGGRGEAIAKAVGIKGKYLPSVIDATAGLGKDAFVLASLGCEVTLFERHPVVGALLDDGLFRAYQDREIGQWMQKRMQLIPLSSFEAGKHTEKRPDVVYLDPMFPHRRKSALVKKEMRLFQLLVGADVDADALLSVACQLAKRRTVVKRPTTAPPLGHSVPHCAIKTKNHRFDIYLK